MRQVLARQTVRSCWLLIETSDAAAGDRAQRFLRNCQAAGVHRGFYCYVEMQGQARPRIEAVGVPGDRVMIKGDRARRGVPEGLTSCNGGSMRRLPASALRAGAGRRSTQTEISEVRK